MYITKTSIPLQQLISGDSLSITSFTCVGSQPGPSIYLQGNIHGPEILGGALLVRLIEFLSTEKDINGRLTIVPLANPIGVQTQSYGFQSGRWNTQNGKDWNRIFSQTLPSMDQTDAIEKTLATTLQSLAIQHDLVLDIHTSGKQSVTHLYTNAASVKQFSSLGAHCILLLQTEDYLNAFDESCVITNAKAGKTTHAATWEAGTHGTIEESELEARLLDLTAFLHANNLLIESSSSNVKTVPNVVSFNSIRTLCADSSGYLIWLVAAGSELFIGEPFAKIYDPSTGLSHECLAPFHFYLLTIYPLQAVSTGQELAKVIHRNSGSSLSKNHLFL